MDELETYADNTHFHNNRIYIGSLPQSYIAYFLGMAPHKSNFDQHLLS